MDKSKEEKWPVIRANLFRMVSVGVIDEPINQIYDVISIGAVVANLVVSVMSTFDNLTAAYGSIFTTVEQVTVFFFAVDFVLRVITAPELYPEESEPRAVFKYCTSLSGIIDILSFLPYYLPVVFPSGIAAFRMFRVVRILRLFRINAYYDSLNVITEVLKSKRQQLLSSVFIIATLMLGSSLCMYSLEHEAQPEVFKNAFSGIWWSVSAMLTVGYGDIYPITPMGKFFSICITFLGVGMVAVPTGIISAGFVEQYTQFKLLGEESRDEIVSFINVRLVPEDAWNGRKISDLNLPAGMMIAAVIRGSDTIVPRGDVTLLSGDRLIIGSEPMQGTEMMELREIFVGSRHEWKGQAVRDLDISRQSFIVMVRRGGEMIVPRGSLVLQENDSVFMYTKKKRNEAVQEKA
ncbi:MAG: ion transporter [Lachnospiraceae bacterium]|nr:ion transporter [Lachnospiraceae bacterium]